ncbi:NGFI-A-binding protein homolog isoform X1 [Anopheles merus]|uniref:NGFI-A-binding protein homolog isoform X1 n=1 Tax=Anopheles merus TaxID=30066 RepID=UPI001BE44857|nr:NGFI-A-binding protein homolog isoform X1 [Anopheles merus]
MELKPRSASPTTVPSGVIVQSALAAGSLPEQIGTESAASSSLLAGSSSCTSPLASTVGQVGHLSDRASEPFGSAGGTATTTSTGSSTVAPAKVAPPTLSSSCSAPIAVHGKRSPSIATPVKSSNVSGGSSSCIPSPILSPPGKIFGRNNNGIMVVTSTPSNEAELQLYRVLQRASLLNYYDTLLEMGGDDVQQLCDAGEEEFLEIMALVGMASKPLHVRRLQKALHEWMTNPSAFQSPLTNVDIPSRIPYSPEPGSIARSVTTASTGPYGGPSTVAGSFSNLTANAAAGTNLPLTPPTPIPSAPASSSSSSSSAVAAAAAAAASAASSTLGHLGAGVGPLGHHHLLHHHHHHHPLSSSNLSSTISNQIGSTTSGSVQLTPSLTEDQVAKIVQAAERLSRTLPRLEPRQQSIKKRSARDLEAVIAMSESDPRRMDEIRKYSAIYGRFDCKRRPEKPLTLHEVCVNEAAAQICKYIPALLTRRDELFPLARQVVRDCGFGHSASIRLTGLSQTQPNRGDELDTVQQLKRARLSSDTSSDMGKENSDDNRDISSGSIYQQISDKPFDLTDSSKFSYTRSEFDDTDSRFSFSNSSSSPVQAGNGADRDLSDPDFGELRSHTPRVLDPTGGSLGVQVISSSGGHIIAVANPALALSPALSEAISIKRETISPDL